MNRPRRLLNFWVLRVGAYSRWLLNRSWALTFFTIYECVHLTGTEANFAFDVWKFLMSFSAWFWDCFKLDCIYIQIRAGYCHVLFVLTEWSSFNVTPRGTVCKLVQSTGGIDCTRGTIEFRPLSLFITVNSKINKLQSNLAISNSVNSKSPLFRRKIECPWIYPSPLRFPGYFEAPLFRTFFHFPWDFEIAGFNCNNQRWNASR